MIVTGSIPFLKIFLENIVFFIGCAKNYQEPKCKRLESEWVGKSEFRKFQKCVIVFKTKEVLGKYCLQKRSKNKNTFI